MSRHKCGINIFNSSLLQNRKLIASPSPLFFKIYFQTRNHFYKDYNLTKNFKIINSNKLQTSFYSTRKNPIPTSIHQLITLELNGEIQYPRDYRRFFKQIENVSDFRDKFAMHSEEILSHHTNSELYTKFWKGLLAGISIVNDPEIHEEFIQFFRYLHNNHLWILDVDLIQKWFHYLGTRQLTVLIAGYFERLVSPTSFKANTECISLDNIEIPPLDLIEKKILNEAFLGQFFKHLYDSSHGSELGSRYIAKYFKQYCMNPNRRPYIAPKNNLIILNGLRAFKLSLNETDFIPLLKHFLSYLESESLTNLQIETLVQLIQVYLQEKPEEYASFLITLYESNLRNSSLLLQNSDFLLGLMTAYSQLGRNDVAGELFGLSITRSLMGGIPQQGQITNILDEVEKWISQHPDGSLTELMKWTHQLLNVNNESKNNDFTLNSNKLIFEKAIRIFTYLEKWTLIRFIFEKYVESSKGFLDRKITSTTLSGYIMNGRMKEAVAFYAQYYRGHSDSLTTVSPSPKEIIKMMDGFIKQNDTKRAIKFFEACMNSTPDCLSSPSKDEAKHLHRVLSTICIKDPSISQNTRKLLNYFGKFVNT